MPKQKSSHPTTPYRLSSATIKKWNRVIFTTMGIGIGGLVLVFAIMAIFFNRGPDSVETVMMYLAIGFGLLAVVVPLIMGALLGGLAIHQSGWVPLLVVIGGLLCTGLAQLDGFGGVLPYAIAAMVLGTIATILLGIFRSQVDVWFGLPVFGSPRLNVRKNKKR
jgi:hypothetical protein